MEFKQIQDLIKLVSESNIGEVTVEQKDFKITIRQKEEQVTQVVQAPMTAPMYQMPQQQLQAPTTASTLPTVAPAASNTVTIKSPMIGTFYRRPAPDKPNFVEAGDEIAVGAVVCIIEAMKLFNEIESEVNGKIVKVLVENASPVEYDQPLYIVEPS